MKSSVFDDSYGWEEGQRVPLAGGMAQGFEESVDPFWRDEEEDGEEEARGCRAPVWWPSEEDRRLELLALSREEAGRVSCGAREATFAWMAGAGLHPSAVLSRYALACALLRPAAGMVREMLETGLRGPAWERWSMERIFPGRQWRGAWESVQGRLRMLSRQGKYETIRDERRLEEVMDWAASESGDWSSEGEIEARAVATMAMGALLDWLGADEAGVLQVVQRFYALLFERYQGTLGTDLSGADLMGLVGQVRATFCELTNRLFEDPLEARLGYRPKVAGQKSAASSAAYAENARRHLPRRQLGGDAGMAREERESMADQEQALREAEAMQRMERLKEAAERRELERDAAEMERIARRNGARRKK